MNAAALVWVTKPKRGVEIGSRCPAGPVMRFDTQTGAFESINSELLDADERLIQRLLLTRTKDEIKEARQRAQQ